MVQVPINEDQPHERYIHNEPNEDLALELEDVSIYYGSYRAVTRIDLPIYKNKITAFIGSSGSGKSTVLRALNRMNDLVPSARVEGKVTYRGKNIYDTGVDPVEVRRRIGMVFQKPNPFPKSIFDNVAYGPRLLGVRDRGLLNEIVENSLKGAALWDEVRGDLKKSGLALSGGQQQRLCIARTIALEPDIILMDEPASALDPIATQRIEELMQELKGKYTIVIVTHNMQQAQRASDYTAFFNVFKTVDEDGMSETRWGEIVEYGPTKQIFSEPKLDSTRRYIAGEFG